MSSCKVSHSYVDESGDLTIVGRGGRSVLGNEGVSRYFMVGVAHLADPVALRKDMESLRRKLLNDPYLSGICSMNPESGKTARSFHAKNDCPEIRMAVFRMLAGHHIRVQVGIRRKECLLDVVRLAHSLKVGWNPDTLYDDLVKRLFKRSLHKADENRICFARRGKSGREKALARAIERARANFQRDTGIVSNSSTQIHSAFPSEEPGLQAVDYFLWAIQRMYERGEDRFFRSMAAHYSLVMDLDDKRSGKPYGTWYSDKNPLTLEKIKPVTG
jgi:hypothetical protein